MVDGLMPCGCALASLSSVYRLRRSSIHTIVQPISFNTNNMTNLRRSITVVFAIGATAAPTLCAVKASTRRTSDPDVLQLDVTVDAGWLPESISNLDRFHPPVEHFFAARRRSANQREQRAIYTLPWFVDVSILYGRLRISCRVPRDTAIFVSELAKRARETMTISGPTERRGRTARPVRRIRSGRRGTAAASTSRCFQSTRPQSSCVSSIRSTPGRNRAACR